MKRIFVGYGQGGITTSLGIWFLSQRLKQYGEISVAANSVFRDNVINYLNGPIQDSSTILIGYSFSASDLEDIARATTREIALGVAIDPTKNWHSVEKFPNGGYVQLTPVNYNKLLCFFNPLAARFEPWGGAQFIGEPGGLNNVDLQTINGFPHMFIQWSQKVWNLTEQAVRDL